MAAFEWIKLETQGAPSPRYGHSLSLVGDQAFVFGGAHGGVADDAPTFYNDMYVLNLTSASPAWKKVAQKGGVPKAREGHSCSVVGKSIYLFAGTGDGDACFQDFHVFDVATETWNPVKYSGAIPSKRNNHASCLIQGTIWIFGGFLDGEAGNDVHSFDTRTNAWTAHKVQGKPPVVRCDHTWVALGNRLVVFGGAGDSVWYNDVHVFQTDTLTWSSPQVKGTPPGERDYHVSFALDDKTMIVFGGANESKNWRHYNDVFFFDLATATWSSPKILGNPPAVRWGHAGAIHSGKLVTFGGTSEDKFYNDLWVLAPSSVKETDLPAKPPRGSNASAAAGSAPKPLAATSSSLSSSSAASPATALEAPTPIPPKRTNYTTTTAIPSPRAVVNPAAPGKVALRDVSGSKNQVIGLVDAIFGEVQKEYLELDQERATFTQEKIAFAQEKKANEELFARQQKELAAMIEQHKEENAELQRKRQTQYEEKMEEIRQRQEALKQQEDKFRQTLMEFDANKKKMEAVMAQFSSFK